MGTCSYCGGETVKAYYGGKAMQCVRCGRITKKGKKGFSLSIPKDLTGL
jgi:hypothetical protein